MRELRAIIVDDEPLAREGLRILCGGDPGAMVNRDRIREVRRRGNAVWVVLSNGRVLPVSRSARGRL